MFYWVQVRRHAWPALPSASSVNNGCLGGVFGVIVMLEHAGVHVSLNEI